MKLWIKIFFTSFIVVIMIPVIYNALIRDVPVALGFLSVEIAIISILFASISIEIAKKSKEIAKDSDEKMKAISNVEFLKIINMLEDARIEFIKTWQGFPGYSPELFTWKTKSCVEMAVELLKKDESKKFIDPDYQDKLFHYFNMSFKHFFKIPNWVKETKSQKHLIDSYALLDDYYNSTRRKELEDYVNSRKEEYCKKFFTEVTKTKK